MNSIERKIKAHKELAAYTVEYMELLSKIVPEFVGKKVATVDGNKVDKLKKVLATLPSYPNLRVWFKTSINGSFSVEFNYSYIDKEPDCNGVSTWSYISTFEYLGNIKGQELINHVFTEEKKESLQKWYDSFMAMDYQTLVNTRKAYEQKKKELEDIRSSVPYAFCDYVEKGY